MKEIIEKEIKWCEEHRGMKSEVYEEAFIAGLKQVLFFINESEKLSEGERETMKYKCLVCDGILEPTESTNDDLLYFEPCKFCNEAEKNKNLVALLNEALPFVSDMVGMASGARHVFHKILRITETHGVDEDEI